LCPGLRNRKAVSEIVAALLLVAIVMAAGTALYFYSSGLLGNLQGGAPQTPLTSKVALDYYDWTCAPPLPLPASCAGVPGLKVTLRNTGTDNLNLNTADFFLLNATWSMKLSLSTQVTFVSPCNGMINVQTSCKVAISLPTAQFNIIRGIAYTLRIVTTKGAVFNFSCLPGSVTS
jgi:flagellin-like protein